MNEYPSEVRIAFKGNAERTPNPAGSRHFLPTLRIFPIFRGRESIRRTYDDYRRIGNVTEATIPLARESFPTLLHAKHVLSPIPVFSSIQNLSVLARGKSGVKRTLRTYVSVVVNVTRTRIAHRPYCYFSRSYQESDVVRGIRAPLARTNLRFDQACLFATRRQARSMANNYFDSDLSRRMKRNARRSNFSRCCSMIGRRGRYVSQLVESIRRTASSVIIKSEYRRRSYGIRVDIWPQLEGDVFDGTTPRTTKHGSQTRSSHRSH